MTDRDGRKRLDSTLATAEAASFDAFEIDCPKCGSQIHVPYGRMPCPACGGGMWNGRCENPDCRLRWYPMDTEDYEKSGCKLQDHAV